MIIADLVRDRQEKLPQPALAWPGLRANAIAWLVVRLC